MKIVINKLDDLEKIDKSIEPPDVKIECESQVYSYKLLCYGKIARVVKSYLGEGLKSFKIVDGGKEISIYPVAEGTFSVSAKKIGNITLMKCIEGTQTDATQLVSDVKAKFVAITKESSYVCNAIVSFYSAVSVLVTGTKNRKIYGFVQDGLQKIIILV